MKLFPQFPRIIFIFSYDITIEFGLVFVVDFVTASNLSTQTASCKLVLVFAPGALKLTSQ